MLVMSPRDRSFSVLVERIAKGGASVRRGSVDPRDSEREKDGEVE